MIYIILTILLFANATVQAQTAETVRYYWHDIADEEVSPASARYGEYTRLNADSSTTIEWRNLKTKVMIKSQTYKNGVPYGRWTYATEDGAIKEQYDYSFETSYKEIPCTAAYEYSLEEATRADGTKGKFEPPVFGGKESYYEFLGTNLRYPEPARDAGWAGKVVIRGTLTKTGKLINLYIAQSPNKVLDAEAMRVVRMIIFKQPARVDGVPIDLCIAIPITFRLE